MGRRGTPFLHLQFMAQGVPPPQISLKLGGTVRGTLGNAVAILWSAFRTAYYVANNDKPYTDHPDLIDLQKANDISVGRA